MLVPVESKNVYILKCEFFTFYILPAVGADYTDRWPLGDQAQDAPESYLARFAWGPTANASASVTASVACGSHLMGMDSCSIMSPENFGELGS